MSDEPVWVTVEQVERLNQAIVDRTGEPYGVNSNGALESAINRPRQHFHWDETEAFDDLVLMGVKLCIGISEAQAFRQGNKRTGFAAMDLFFRLNGFTISGSAHTHIADLILESAHPDHALRLLEEDFAEAIDQFVVVTDDAIGFHDFINEMKAMTEQIEQFNQAAVVIGAASQYDGFNQGYPLKGFPTVFLSKPDQD